jgi:hypothetical protein
VLDDWLHLRGGGLRNVLDDQSSSRVVIKSLLEDCNTIICQLII